MTDVTLGDVVFDPIETNDFRLSLEGTSNVGKTNTLAVILEDLAAVRVPTLIIERLGALTPVRFEVEDLIVIGATDEEGIDLPVPLEDLDRIGSWVLDEGLKVLVDISTYADYEEDWSRVHLAAATAIQSLNDRAHEKYRKRGRTRSLLVIDEAHWLAPKDNAPDPVIDDWVKRCRGQIIKASTEGGNKGISVITAFQRRAFIHNGAIQLCDDFIAHKPGPEDIDRTADVLRCDPDDLAALETGEIFARGPAITDGELIGPTKVRRRSSPDPRDETFELPEVSGETSEFLDSIREDLEAERERRSKRQDELERLRAENERLEGRVEELQEELADTERLANALENFQSGGQSAVEVGEGVEGLQERVAELKAEREELVEDREIAIQKAEQLKDEVATREERIADLEAEVQELRASFEAAAEHIEAVAETFDVEMEAGAVPAPGDTDARVEELEAELKELRERNRELREAEGFVTIPEEYTEFYEHPVVEEAIDAATAKSGVSKNAVWGIIFTIEEHGGAVDYDTISDWVGYKDNTQVSKAASELENREVIKQVGERPKEIDFNFGGMEAIERKTKRRNRMEDRIQSKVK